MVELNGRVYLPPHHRIYIAVFINYRGDDVTEITFKVKKPHGWEWLKDDYFKRFEKDDELRDRVSKLVYHYMRQQIKTSEEEKARWRAGRGTRRKNGRRAPTSS